ncbi:hypothetical protein BKA93DRAFT_828401 [Sparassis latifolia]
MKLNVPLLLASACLVTASPLRVVVTSHQEVTSGSDAAVARISNVVAQVYPPPPGAPGTKHHCSGSFRDKAIHLSNTIFGIPALPPPPSVWIMNHGPAVPPFAFPEALPVELEDKHHVHAHDHFDGEETEGTQDGLKMEMAQPSHGVGRGPHREFAPVHIMHMGGHRHRSFLRRVHFALMALGPWEGRAVAFVLGCGIGVLLRMLFVIGVVLVRALKGRRGEPEEIDVLFETDAAEVVPPPQYTEKVPVAVEEKASAPVQV